MRFFNNQVDLSNYVETVVIPKGDAEFVFKARPVRQADYEEFALACPAPKAPIFFKPGSNAAQEDTADPTYLANLAKYRKHRTDFMFFTSLSATEGLEWDTVVKDDPSTWGNINEELQKAGFLDQEIVLLYNAVIAANGLDSERIKKATQSFLAMAENQAA